MYVLVCGAALSAFDEYSSSCMRPGGGRAAKAWPDPPCDFSNQAWCTAPGSAYPWHAVRRFVQENQGLMRRMYGDMRQISVLRAEFESNDLYPGDGADFQVVRDGVTKHYRPIAEASSTPRSKPVATAPKVAPSTTTRKPTKVSLKPASKSTTTPATTTTTSTTVRTTTTTTTTAASTTTTTRNVTLVPSTVSTATEEDTTEGSTTLAPDTTSVSELAAEALALEQLGEELVESQQGQPEDQQAEESEFEEEAAELIDEEDEYEDEGVEEDEQHHDQSLTKGPQMMRKGVNACPVKEEVVAPFWANNTRGEILALLNLYPFEQYVHWEKCTDEHQQMFCRDGCRCEQQYRLHRLLAYDPRNECRGIFSDWFKFPSCCVCKCYDIPPEFRLTSRSPRRKHKKQKKPTGLEPKLRTPIYINTLDQRVEGGGEVREDLKAIVHTARAGRDFPETATIGTVDAATPHFYYQPPPVALVHLSRRPRDAD
ncbi:protein spaetzle 4 isoform X2 [Neocloeon triangulifer]|uniref:protein spaetzle 4 isoform X2 n=1 Tax=Neocloeon triangulifer TaxID=2078957 RepID=UPI00286EDA6C|nr:protein spaetzle 4 isoform X2 [Neocloeon triangulifer]